VACGGAHVGHPLPIFRCHHEPSHFPRRRGASRLRRLRRYAAFTSGDIAAFLALCDDPVHGQFRGDCRSPYAGSVRGTGRWFDSEWVHVFGVRNGKITTLWGMRDTEAQAGAR
jgi:hypothetical protein